MTPLRKQLISAAAVLAAIVTITTSYDALAELIGERQPLATKSYVMAANEETLRALTEQLSLITNLVNEQNWTQTVYRQKELARTLPAFEAEVIGLEIYIRNNPDAPDIVDLTQDLAAQKKLLAADQAEFKLFTCRIENRGRTADCE